ncbi:TrkA-N domain protein [Desulfurobacterium thermolithotrophum DSM 11699]|uniref:TrkA-N domain protein n=1 Tax=Desulfurobacterium thermolithotrophum (strain DSM 11699 / BSA) TaxID=868864 RepID=F0S2Z8_DESTD|nr:NAD-binding protein [Desulfurobacterium thermolithotrophum]ADY73220.1 TrkA-N domain protein [Desulfurobacterium thermolithotrophum DSM 11699]
MRKIEKRIPPKYGQERVLEILMKFRAPLIVALLAVMLSTIGYMLISDVDLLKAFYMTILTVTTIGYGEMWDMDAKARIFNVLVMTLGVGSVMGYSIAVLINIVTSGEVKKILRFRKMVSDISALKGHYIVFGVNDYVLQLIKEMKYHKIPVVVVDTSEDLENFAKEHEVNYYLQLDPADENTLYLAGIEKAIGAIIATMDDYRNLAITLTVKNVVTKNEISPFFILALVKKEEFKEKLKLVGADHVETIPSIISKRVAILARKPPIFGERSLLEEILFGEHTFIDIEELVVEEDSPVIGKTLEELDLRKKFGITVIAVKKTNEKVIFTPGGDIKIEPLDILVVVAPKKKLEEAVKVLFKGKVTARSAMLKKKIKERLHGLE